MGITRLIPGIHRVRDTPFARTLRRRLNDPDIITFKHRATNQWILAYWLDRRRGIVDEIEDLGPNFELCQEQLVADLERCRGTVDFKKHKRRVIERRRDHARKMTDDTRELSERHMWLQKKLGTGVYYG